MIDPTSPHGAANSRVPAQRNHSPRVTTQSLACCIGIITRRISLCMRIEAIRTRLRLFTGLKFPTSSPFSPSRIGMLGVVARAKVEKSSCWERLMRRSDHITQRSTARLWLLASNYVASYGVLALSGLSLVQTMGYFMRNI